MIAWFGPNGDVSAQRFGGDSPTRPIVTQARIAAGGPSVVALPWGGFLIGWPTVTDGNRQDLMRFFDAQGLIGS